MMISTSNHLLSLRVLNHFNGKKKNRLSPIKYRLSATVCVTPQPYSYFMQNADGNQVKMEV